MVMSYRPQRFVIIVGTLCPKDGAQVYNQRIQHGDHHGTGRK